MFLLRFLWRYKIGTLIAVAWFICSFILLASISSITRDPTILRLVSIGAFPGLIGITFDFWVVCGLAGLLSFRGVGEACAPNWLAFLGLFITVVLFLFVGAITEFMIRKFFGRRNEITKS